LEEYDFIESFHYKKIVEVLIYESELKSRLITYNSAEFYEHLCENYPEIIKQVPSKYIAEFMRISPGWLIISCISARIQPFIIPNFVSQKYLIK